MPFNIGSFLNDISDKLFNSPTLLSIAKNPIMSALLITMLTFIVILFVFANANDSLLILASRAAFWLFIISMGVMFLHNKILLHEIDEREKNGAFESIINSALDKNVVSEGYVPVMINTEYL
jgi:multisubunit Na+/H+ antiporter MnhB subunit